MNAQNTVNLAEAIQFSAGEILVVLLVLLAILVAAGAVVVMGFIWARRAGKGSKDALIGWGIIAAGEFVVLVGILLNGEILLSGFILAGALAGQSALYYQGRKQRDV